MPNLGLLGITMAGEQFFETATEGADVSIDVDKHTLEVSGEKFEFQLSQMENELHDNGGISSAFRRFGNKLSEVMTSSKYSGKGERKTMPPETRPELEW
jgi:3-isopropylmalate dehydratase small subunit